ncbi:DUF1281 domain-containing protein [Escherichia coli]|uniref:DUF1281 domain-containing protein n=1 Tax=Escherichia coli TaxID=562 RepID=UPI00177AC5C6|nr:DUF1281 domain-containing protein [Escherichia coli]MBE0323372.1 DUF1281 domain-containing protein [Escherichia coli]
MHFSGEPAQIAEIKRLASGAVTPLYRRATNEGIQLFLAGSAGLLQTTEDVQFEPCPGLTDAGRGVVSPENIAFTRWLTHLQNGVGYEVNISRQGENFIQVDFDTPWCQPESNVVAELSRRFGCTLEHWYAEQGCNFCGWQRYERGELVDVLWGELEWSSPTDDDELPEVTAPEWIVDKVAHYGG